MPTGDAYSSGHLVTSLWDLHMFYLLRQILFPNLSLLFRTMLFEYPSVLSPFCLTLFYMACLIRCVNSYILHIYLQLFPGNTGVDEAVVNPLPNPIRTSTIRLRPRSWHKHISLRFDVIGCWMLKYEGVITDKTASFSPFLINWNGLEVLTVSIRYQLSVFGMKYGLLLYHVFIDPCLKYAQNTKKKWNSCPT